MELKRAGTIYRCLRLPLSGAPGAVIPLDVPPAGEQNPPPTIELAPPPPAMQNEGGAVKKE
jgi:hypothetical protein